MKNNIILRLFACIFALCLIVEPTQAKMPEPVHFISDEILLTESKAVGENVTLVIEAETPETVTGGVCLFEEDSEARMVQEEAILEYQNEIAAAIKAEVGADVVPGHRYTLLFNGFTVEAGIDDIEKIKSIDGVKDVYLCDDIKLEPHLYDTPGIISALPQNTGNYTGKGQLIAVIDNEFNVNHPFFSVAPEGAKYTEDAIAKVISETGIDVDASKSYVSSKVPFAYNYTDKSYKLSSSTLSHGTHVAGIAAGCSPDADGLKGIASSAQLALMRVSDESGGIDEADVIKALEDAAKLGVCAINISIGADYTSVYTAPLLQKCMDSIRDAGIFISASAGNKTRGFHKTQILTTNPDYSAIGSVAAFESTFSVGSVNKPSSGTIAVSSYSSYGVGEDLVLSPDISAPGAAVYSSVKSGSYANSNGTSMAAPHVAGAYAVMCEYFEKNHPDISGRERLELIGKCLMSASVPTKNGTVEYTPRVQGSGVLNVAAAIATPVVLNGYGEKSKVNLGSDLSDSFSISFTAENISASDASYDDISMSVFTDSYSLSGKRNIVSGVKMLNASHNLPGHIDIPAGKKVEIKADISLDEGQTSSLSKVFTNGFFIDGFIYLKRNDGTLPDLSIPFMGFYGDWTKAPIFDTTLYHEYGSALNASNVGGASLIYSREQGSSLILGKRGDEAYNSKLIAISPNSDSVQDELLFQFTPLRTLKLNSSSILKSNKSLLYSTSYDGILLNKFNTRTLDFASARRLGEGDYYIRLAGVYNYSAKTPAEQTIELPFYVDKSSPGIYKLTRSGNKISVTAKDNRYLSHAYTYYADKSGAVHTERLYAVNSADGAEHTFEFDLGNISAENVGSEDIYIFVHDMAGNYYVNSLSCLGGMVHPQLSSVSYTQGVFRLGLSFRNYSGAGSCDMLLAFYTSDGKLLHVSSYDDVSLASGTSHKTFTARGDIANAGICTLYMWNTKESLVPFDTQKSFNISEDIK